MATKIARGQNGQADFVNNISGVPFINQAGWTLAGAESAYDYTWNGTPNVNNPKGWGITNTGTMSVPSSATLGTYNVQYFTYNAGLQRSSIANYTFEVICIVEVVTVGTATWNSSTNKWDYPVTITGQGGTPPYSSTPSSSLTVSLAPNATTTLSSTTTDSGSPQCSASSSTPIGPAKIPPGPPVEGEGPSVDEDDDSDFVLIDYPITGNPTCPLTANQMKAKPQTTGNVTSTSSSKKSKSSSTYVPKRSTGLIDTSEEALKGKLKIGVGL